MEEGRRAAVESEGKDQRKRLRGHAAQTKPFRGGSDTEYLKARTVM
jgi:hypothetical protein